MGETLVEYEGSKAGSVHKIIRGNDGVVYCDCWAWKINKTCKHLDRFFSKFTNRVPISPNPTLPTPSHTTILPSVAVRTASELISAIDPTFWDEAGGTNEDNKDTA